MDTVGENFRGIHATQLLDGSRGWTLEKLQDAAFDSYQPGFTVLVPALLRAYDALPATDARRRTLEQPIAVLRTWNYRWAVDSVAQTLGIFWGDALIAALHPPPEEDSNLYMARLARDTTDTQKLDALDTAMRKLRHDFGRWQVPWGEVNRFQRISRSIRPEFSDEGPSIPVPFGNANYGSLASFVMRSPKTTKHLYGTYGNSFVAVVEFGSRVRAHAITAGGESGDPKSPHFKDQAQRYASGNLREVYFYPDQLKGHIERTYRPGE
jgi:acyl-homoserine-lactone acylase